MESITQLVAQNLKRLREDKKLSLEKLAELTGVSKSMLAQIERGDSSPTITTVWKISNGLKVSFTDLLTTPQSETGIVHINDIQPMVEDHGKYRLYPLFPIQPDRRFEIYTIEIETGGHLSAEPHPEGTQEFLTIFQGKLSVRVAGQEYRLAAGDGIRFRADSAHEYLNPGLELAKISLTIFYP